MIVVRMEMWPHGDKSKARHLGTCEIWNDGTMTTRAEGNYGVKLSRWSSPTAPWRQGKVKEFPRLKLGPWDLLLWALLSTLHGRTLGLSGRPRVSGDGKRTDIDPEDQNLRWQTESPLSEPEKTE